MIDIHNSLCKYMEFLKIIKEKKWLEKNIKL